MNKEEMEKMKQEVERTVTEAIKSLMERTGCNARIESSNHRNPKTFQNEFCGVKIELYF